MKKNKDRSQCDKNKNEEIIEEIINDNSEINDNVEISDKSDEIKNLNDKLARMQADFVNYKNRVEREKKELIQYSNEKLILQILPTVDNLERALLNYDENDEFQKGIFLIYKSLLKVLKEENVEEINSDGMEFNPNEHNAIMLEENDSVLSNHVIETLQKGYKIKDKIIRPSMVKVSK